METVKREYRRCPLSELPEEIEISYRQRENYKYLKFDFLARCPELESYIVHYKDKRGGVCYVMLWKKFDGKWMVIDQSHPDPIVQEMLGNCSIFAHLALASGIEEAVMTVETPKE